MLQRVIFQKKYLFVLFSIRESPCLILWMHEMHMKTSWTVKLSANERHYYYSRYNMNAADINPILPSCRCNDQHGYFPLFLCHGHGRMSEPNTQITAAILIESFEWISKVYTECIATDRFSLGQPHYYFLRLWKGKVLTDLLEVTLVFPPNLFTVTVTECVISLPRTQWENSFAIQSKDSVLLCQGYKSLHMVHCPFPN